MPEVNMSSSLKFGNLKLHNAEKVSKYTTDLIEETEKLITQTIPDKILQLDKINKEEFQPVKDMLDSEIVVPDNVFAANHVINHVNNIDGHVPLSKKRKLEDEDGHAHSIPCNKKLVRLMDLIKPEIKDIIEACERIQMWIQLLIPRIEDGNNFGVSIQEEVLNEVNRILSESANYLDVISRYFVNRAKVVSKLVKYPYIDDYRRGIKEIDDKAYLSLQFSFNEIRNHYLLILDVVSKNYEKIKKPRSSYNLESMY